MMPAADTIWDAVCGQLIAPHHLKLELPERWVRFYSLPDGKRYPASAAESAEIRRRADVLLADACGGTPEVMLVTGLYGPAGVAPVRSTAQLQAQPSAAYWREVREFDAETNDWSLHQWVSLESYSPGRFDPIVDLVASEELPHTLVVAPVRNVVVYFYDGGADVILPSAAERARWYERHKAWASSRSDGL